EDRARVLQRLDEPEGEMPWPLIRTALESPARVAVIPMQDALALDGSHRMNRPGTTEGNWGWRFDWGDVPPGRAGDLRRMNEDADRIPDR
ncbi:4-alpha-glucanotransferase, partial [Nocardia farcinica]|uniref:4-alpha-glucanotransferase n=2 Tax=Bacteria TaxID=2 RepID=UPI0018952945